MIELHPGDSGLKLDLAISMNGLGDVHETLGDHDANVRNYAKVVSLMREVAEASSGSPAAHSHLAVGLSWYGNALYKAGRAEDAVPVFEEQLGLAKEWAGRYTSGAPAEHIIGSACFLFGKALDSLGNTGAARLAWEEGAAALEPLAEKGDETPSLALDTYARTLLKLGRTGDGMAVVDELRLRNYASPLFWEFCEELGIPREAP